MRMRSSIYTAYQIRGQTPDVPRRDVEPGLFLLVHNVPGCIAVHAAYQSVDPDDLIRRGPTYTFALLRQFPTGWRVDSFLRPAWIENTGLTAEQLKELADILDILNDVGIGSPAPTPAPAPAPEHEAEWCALCPKCSRHYHAPMWRKLQLYHQDPFCEVRGCHCGYVMTAYLPRS